MVAIGLVGIAAGAVVALLLQLGRGVHHVSSDDADWGDVAGLEDLVARSQEIVVATLESSKEVSYEIPSSVNPSVSGRVTEIVHTLTVEEVLKGNFEPGQRIAAVETLGSVRPLAGSTSLEERYEVLYLPLGSRHVYFLVRGQREPYRPDAFGEVFYARPAEPGVAELATDGRLTFVVSDRYASDMR